MKAFLLSRNATGLELQVRFGQHSRSCKKCSTQLMVGEVACHIFLLKQRFSFENCLHLLVSALHKRPLVKGNTLFLEVFVRDYLLPIERTVPKSRDFNITCACVRMSSCIHVCQCILFAENFTKC